MDRPAPAPTPAAQFYELGDEITPQYIKPGHPNDGNEGNEGNEGDEGNEGNEGGAFLVALSVN